MPTMSRLESAFCRGVAWRAFAGRVVLPWALQGERVEGEVLELGTGSGAMAAHLLARRPGVRLTATDYDPAMVEMARSRLARFARRAGVQQADATRLAFPDGRFDAVLSFLMLHHVIHWEAALAEAVRVLRPGGRLIGYDLVTSRPARWIHETGGSDHRLMTQAELAGRLADLPVEAVTFRPGLVGLVTRFTARKLAG